MKWISLEPDQLASEAAKILLTTIRTNPRAVLGLPTGRTPIGMYQEVVRECSRGYHCFRDVKTFNLDEYVGVAADDPGSYATYMREHLYSHIDIDPGHAHIPNGCADDLRSECARYESMIAVAGGLDVTFLGLGRNGHIGFNEPGTAFDSRTRVVSLTESTRNANAELFPERPVPTQAITMGIATILESKRIILLVSGRGKRAAIERLRSGERDASFPASALWMHDDVTVLLAVEAE